MKVIGKLKLEEFWKRHPKAEKALRRWITITENAEWNGFSNIRNTFNSADLFKKENRRYVIFNAGGNKYRIITVVNFRGYLVVIKVILTHSEYSKEKWKAKL